MKKLMLEKGIREAKHFLDVTLMDDNSYSAGYYFEFEEKTNRDDLIGLLTILDISRIVVNDVDLLSSDELSLMTTLDLDADGKIREFAEKVHQARRKKWQDLMNTDVEDLNE